MESSGPTSALTLGFPALDSCCFSIMAPLPSPTGAASLVVPWPHHRQNLFSWFLLSQLRKADVHNKTKLLLHRKVEIRGNTHKQHRSMSFVFQVPGVLVLAP